MLNISRMPTISTLRTSRRLVGALLNPGQAILVDGSGS